MNDDLSYSVACFKIKTQEEADAYFERLVQWAMETGQNRAQAEATQRANLGYFAGYGSHEDRIRVERLYRCRHPVFGSASHGAPTAEEAFEAGKDLWRGIAHGAVIAVLIWAALAIAWFAS